MRNEGFSFTFGGVRMEVCSREAAFMFATSRTRSQLRDEGPSRPPAIAAILEVW